MSPSQQPRARSGWAILGIGCLVVVGLLLMGAVGFGFMTWRWARDVETAHKDPEIRTERARDLLGCARIPDGYHALAAVSVPLLVDVAVLSDRPPDARGEIDGFDQLGFVFLRSRRFGPKREKLLDFFEGRDTRMNSGGWDLQFDDGEIVTRGATKVGGRDLRYVVQRGSFAIQDDVRDGLATLFLLECPDDRRARLGVWFGPDPSPDVPTSELDLAGSLGDESRLTGFVSHFDLCAP